jgi:hypothetical protein
MRSRLVTVLASVLLACLLIPALAQQPGGQPGGKGKGGPPGGFGGGMGGVGFGMSRLFLLRLPEIQKELELVDEQMTAIQKLQEELGRGRGGPPGQEGDRRRGKGGEDGKKGPTGADLRRVPADWYFVQAQGQNQPQGQGRRPFGQPPTEEERAQFEQQRLERAREEKAKLAEILLPHQLKRLNEIYLQIAGVGALQDEDVAKELNITADQKVKMTAVREEHSAKRREMFTGGGGGGDREALMAKMTEMRKVEDEQVLGVLTADQKAKLTEMKGKPFDLPEGALRAGFGGRGPGGPGSTRGKGGPPKGNNN